MRVLRLQEENVAAGELIERFLDSFYSPAVLTVTPNNITLTYEDAPKNVKYEDSENDDEGMLFDEA